MVKQKSYNSVCLDNGNMYFQFPSPKKFAGIVMVNRVDILNLQLQAELISVQDNQISLPAVLGSLNTHSPTIKGG